MTEQGKSWMIPLRLQLRADCCHALCNIGRVHKHAQPEEPRICVIHAHRVQINFLIFKNNLPRFHRLDLDTFVYAKFFHCVYAKLISKFQIHVGFYSELNHLIQRYAPLSDASVCPKRHVSGPYVPPMKGLSTKITFISFSLFFF